MATGTCFGCKHTFRKEELVHYTSLKAKNGHWFCPKCLEERQSRDAFSDKVCEIFGIKSPGPVIWRQREALIKKYGYTDQTIMDCLDYMYNVKHTKKISETLYFVTPYNIDQMKQYKRRQSANSGSIIAAINQPMEVQEVEVQENTKSNKQRINPDDWLEDD